MAAMALVASQVLYSRLLLLILTPNPYPYTPASSGIHPVSSDSHLESGSA